MDGSAGSSAQFLVTTVFFEDHGAANNCDERINLIRKELGFKDGVEFHFSGSSPDTRRYFLEQVARYEFFYMTMVLNKAGLAGAGLVTSESFYKFTVSLMFQSAKPYLNGATVILDRCGEKQFCSQLKRYLRARASSDDGHCVVKKIKAQPSHGNNLLQLTDMVCGAVARSLGKKNDKDTYRNLIKHRELSLQVRP